MSDPELLAKLDQIIALMRLAFREPIEQARTSIRSDPVNAAILDAAADDWISSGSLRQRVIAQTHAADRTIQRRIAELLAAQALSQQGATSSRAYRTTGLV